VELVRTPSYSPTLSPCLGSASKSLCELFHPLQNKKQTFSLVFGLKEKKIGDQKSKIFNIDFLT
jgi:hypothetical protein